MRLCSSPRFLAAPLAALSCQLCLFVFRPALVNLSFPYLGAQAIYNSRDWGFPSATLVLFAGAVVAVLVLLLFIVVSNKLNLSIPAPHLDESRFLARTNLPPPPCRSKPTSDIGSGSTTGFPCRNASLAGGLGSVLRSEEMR